MTEAELLARLQDLLANTKRNSLLTNGGGVKRGIIGSFNLKKPYQGKSALDAIALTNTNTEKPTILLRASDGQWVAMQEQVQGVVHRRRDIDRSVSETPLAPTSLPIKYVYSITVGSEKVFYVGGWRQEPVEAIRIPTSAYIAHASINNLAGDDWLVCLCADPTPGTMGNTAVIYHIRSIGGGIETTQATPQIWKPGTDMGKTYPVGAGHTFWHNQRYGGNDFATDNGFNKPRGSVTAGVQYAFEGGPLIPCVGTYLTGYVIDGQAGPINLSDWVLFGSAAASGGTYSALYTASAEFSEFKSDSGVPRSPSGTNCNHVNTEQSYEETASYSFSANQIILPGLEPNFAAALRKDNAQIGSAQLMWQVFDYYPFGDINYNIITNTCTIEKWQSHKTLRISQAGDRGIGVYTAASTCSIVPGDSPFEIVTGRPNPIPNSETIQAALFSVSDSPQVQPISNLNLADYSLSTDSPWIDVFDDALICLKYNYAKIPATGSLEGLEFQLDKFIPQGGEFVKEALAPIRVFPPAASHTNFYVYHASFWSSSES